MTTTAGGPPVSEPVGDARPAADDRPGWHRPGHWPREALVLVIRAYQLLVSPLLGPVCRFAPSCSSYAVVAVRRFGVLRGSWLTARRLARCHPWNPGGYDPVPQRRTSGPVRDTTVRETTGRTPAP